MTHIDDTITDLMKESEQLGLDPYSVTHLWVSLNNDSYISLKMRKYISKFLKEDDPINQWLSEINEKTAQIPQDIRKEILCKLPHLPKISNYFYPHVTSEGKLHNKISDALTAKGYKHYFYCDFTINVVSLKTEEEWKTDFPDFANKLYFTFKHFDIFPPETSVDELE